MAVSTGVLAQSSARNDYCFGPDKYGADPVSPAISLPGGSVTLFDIFILPLSIYYHSTRYALEILLGQGTMSAFQLSSRYIGNWSVSELNIWGKYEKTALSDGSIDFVPFDSKRYFCLTQGVNLTFGQGTRSGYLPAESGSAYRSRT